MKEACLVQSLRKSNEAAFRSLYERYHHRLYGYSLRFVKSPDYLQYAHQAIAHLLPQRRLVFEICRVEGKSYEEAAQLLSISKGTVKDHIIKAKKFIRLNVEVLGTEFNVRQRPENTAVLLKSGKVRLNLRNQPDTLNMSPGELVTLRSQSRRLDKEAVNPEAYTSWTKRRLDFDGTTLRKIARIIEETYGYEVVIRGRKLS